MKQPVGPSWLTGKADAASLASLLERLGSEVEPATIDELWLFPTRRVGGVESTVFVLSVDDHDDVRRVLTAHTRATRNKRGEPSIELKLDEHASAPADRLPRIIEGVLRRLSDDFASTPPSHATIERSTARWQDLIEVLMSVKPNEPLSEELLASAASDVEEVEVEEVDEEHEMDAEA